MAQEVDSTISGLSIVPLSSKKQIRGVFKSIDDEQYARLTNWLQTAAIVSDRDCSSKTYLAQIDGATVGYIAVSMTVVEDAYMQNFKLQSKTHPQVMLIGKLYVIPRFRGRGIGRELVEFTIGMCREIDGMTGCLGVIVDADNQNETIHFYERNGFAKLSGSSIVNRRTTKMFCKVTEKVIPVQ